MIFVGRWSIGNVQMIYLWYDRLIPNPNSFDVVSHTNHCDIELDISMFLVHLDRPLQCKQCWHLTISTPCASPAGIHQNRWKVPSTGDVCEWRKTELGRFGVTWNNDVGSIPSTKMYLPVYIKYICLLSVTKGGRGSNDTIIQSAIQLVVIKIIMYQNIIWMYGSKMYVLY